MTEHVKLFFRVERDEDGYPPIGVESLWATPTGRTLEYTVDNIPFYTREATLGDVVEAKEEQGALWYSKTVTRSGNSLIRIVFYRPELIAGVRESLDQMGCSTEWVGRQPLVAVNVPVSVDIGSIQAFLEEHARNGSVDYGEPILRQ